MRYFDLSWPAFLSVVKEWHRLSLPARQALLKVPSQGVFPAKTFNASLPELQREGWIDSGDPQHARITTLRAPSLAAIQVIAKIDIFDGTIATASRYLDEHFSNDEMYRVSSELHVSRYNLNALAERTTSIDYVEAFLSATSRASRPKQELLRFISHSRPGEDPGGDMRFAQRIVDYVRQFPGPFTFQELSMRLTHMGEGFPAGLREGVRRAVLYPVMSSPDLILGIGLWPAIYTRQKSLKLPPPQSVKPLHEFCGAFLMDDMMVVLVAAATSTLRVRQSDSMIFAKAEQELTAALTPLPGWLCDFFAVDPDERLSRALQWLDMACLTEIGESKDGKSKDKVLSLQATELGKRWLAETPKQRLRELLDSFANRPETPSAAKSNRNRANQGKTRAEDAMPRMKFFHYPPATVTGINASYVQLCRDAIAAFAQTKPGEFISFDGFAHWHSLNANPWKSPAAEVPVQRTTEQLEKAWRDALSYVLGDRLLSFGGVRIGSHSDSRQRLFTLTDIGRYILGLADDFAYDEGPADGSGPIIVQPNFEVVFLAHSPAAEVAVARFAERKGRGVGSLFTITKKSIMGAAERGDDAAKASDVLQRWSGKPLPGNVSREIEGWFAQCRRIALRHVTLLTCPDAETAARVAALGGDCVSVLNPTTIELRGKASQKELLRKLRDAGIFL